MDKLSFGLNMGGINCNFPESQLVGEGIVENNRVMQSVAYPNITFMGSFFKYVGPSNITVRNNTIHMF